MLHPRVYALSKKHGPPRIDLRKAEILDSYGDESHATRPIHHRVPEDVSRADLDFYGWVYAFMEFEDLLFYLYPVALEYAADKELDCINPFMYSLDRCFPEKIPQLNSDDRGSLLEGLQWIWDAASLGYADWIQCPNLQSAIGVSATWDDIQYDR